MPHGAEPAVGSFPSRRSLREAGSSGSIASPRHAGPADNDLPEDDRGARSSRSGSPHNTPLSALILGAPEPRGTRAHAIGAIGVDASCAEVRTAHPILARAESSGDLDGQADRSDAAPRRRPVTVRRVLSSALALSCATGLVLTLALPALSGPSAGIETAAALPQQELVESAAGFSLPDSFDALGTVSAEASDNPGDFVNFTDAEVQFPFATGQQLTDGFGPRSYPVAGMHDAQDFAAPDGTTVQAIARGKVLETGDTADGCGFGVLLQHRIDGMDVTSRYCHMQAGSNDLEVDQWVNVGDPVGRVGATGLAFGAHLHFALTVNGEAVDPMPFLTQYNRSTRTR